MFVFWFDVCCVGIGLCDELITGLEESYRLCVCRIACDPEILNIRRSWAYLGCWVTWKINYFIVSLAYYFIIAIYILTFCNVICGWHHCVGNGTASIVWNLQNYNNATHPSSRPCRTRIMHTRTSSGPCRTTTIHGSIFRILQNYKNITHSSSGSCRTTITQSAYLFGQ